MVILQKTKNVKIHIESQSTLFNQNKLEKEK